MAKLLNTTKKYEAVIKPPSTENDNYQLLEMIEALNEAAELEHLLAMQYIYAAVSLKSFPEEFPDTERKWWQLYLTQRWKGVLHSIYREEMQHLNTVNEVLIAIGAEPHLSRPNFPVDYYYRQSADDTKVPAMTLTPFSLDTIKRFMWFESRRVDKNDQWYGDLLRILGNNIVNQPRDGGMFGDTIPAPTFYRHLAELYNKVINGLTEEMFAPFIDPFTGTDDSDDDLYPSAPPGRKPTFVKDLKSARDALVEVIEEGEGGAELITPDCHLFKFLQIYLDLEKELEESGKRFVPSKKVMTNPQLRFHPETADGIFDNTEKREIAEHDLADERVAHPITDDLGKKFLDLLGGSYEFLIVWLRQFYSRRVSSLNQLKAIAGLGFFPYMSDIILPIAEIMTSVEIRNLQDANPDPFLLGPSFEITSSAYSFPRAKAVNRLQKKRLDQLVKDADDLYRFCLGENNVPRLPPRTLEWLNYVKDSYKYLRQAYHYRCLMPQYNYMTNPKTNPYSENINDFNPGYTPPFTPEVNMTVYLKIDFEGWAQCRLPTDPDHSYEKRGVAGNSFAFADEPDLDRVIRFLPKDTHMRPFIDDMKIGVNVVKATINKPGSEIPVTEVFDNAVINLGDDPYFQGRNQIFADYDKEMIDPFNFNVLKSIDDGTVLLSRKVKGPEFSESAAQERMDSGRIPVDASLRLKQNLVNIHREDLLGDPKQYWTNRFNKISEELDKEKNINPFSAKTLALQGRYDYLKANKDTDNSKMNQRIAFYVRYQHLISGDATIASEFGTVQGYKLLLERWLTNYEMFFFDTDAMTFYVKGYLCIPLSEVRAV